MYNSESSEASKHVLNSCSYRIHDSDDNIKYEYSSVLPFTTEQSELVEILDGRFDSEIVIPSYITIDSLDMPCVDDTMADIIFLDIKSMYYILKQRFAQFVPDKCGKLAKQYTMQFLDGIVNKYQCTKISFLLMYMSINLYILGKHDLHRQICEFIYEEGADSTECFSIIKINSEYLQSLSELYNIAHTKLIKLINKFE